jgi:hypothetical protein
MKQLITVFAILHSINLYSQDLPKLWIDSITNYSSFKEIDLEEFNNWNFDKILSNRTASEGDPMSTYIGFFGPKFRRIDFQLKVLKKNTNYTVEGRSKLGENIRPLSGNMKLIKAFLRTQDYITDSLYIGLFQTSLSEPGNKSGDGIYEGVFTVVFLSEQKWDSDLFNFLRR